MPRTHVYDLPRRKALVELILDRVGVDTFAESLERLADLCRKV